LMREYNVNFSVWDFLYIKGHMIEDKLSWNYKNIGENKSCWKRKFVEYGYRWMGNFLFVIKFLEVP